MTRQRSCRTAGCAFALGVLVAASAFAQPAPPPVETSRPQWTVAAGVESLWWRDVARTGAPAALAAMVGRRHVGQRPDVRTIHRPPRGRNRDGTGLVGRRLADQPRDPRRDAGRTAGARLRRVAQQRRRPRRLSRHVHLRPIAIHGGGDLWPIDFIDSRSPQRSRVWARRVIPSWVRHQWIRTGR